MPVPSDTTRTNQKAWWLNDFDMTRLGFVVDSVMDHSAGLSFPNRTTALPGHTGTIALAREWESKPRKIVVEGTISASSSNQAVRDTDEIKRRCYQGNVELRFSDEPEHLFYARCEDFRVTLLSPGLRTANRVISRVRATFLCQDPTIYDRYSTIAAFSTAKGETPIGTSPSLPTLRIYGPSTGSGYVLTYRNAAGTSQATLTLSGAAAVMSSTEYATINMELQTITHSDGTNLLSVLSTGSTFFSLDPEDAAGSTGPYPTIEINATGVSGDALYRKAYI